MTSSSSRRPPFTTSTATARAFSTDADATADSRPILRGVVFDMDGTLTVPNLDFADMYRRCGVDVSEDILEAVENMSAADAAEANRIIEEIEEEGRRTLELVPGAVELGNWLRFHRVPAALVTRNTERTVDVMVERLWTKRRRGSSDRDDDHDDDVFSPVLSRDNSDLPPKPDPASFDLIKATWGFPSLSSSSGGTDEREDLLMVGDSPSNDVAFGKAAGVSTALVDTGRKHGEGGDDGGADIVVNRLEELAPRVWRTFRLNGPLGVKLIKYDAPVPSSPASRAAADGDLDALSSLDDDELWRPEIGRAHV